jgi:hypothetical protein
MSTPQDAQSTTLDPLAVDVLILGAGCTSQFLIAECQRLGVTWAGTRRSKVDGCIYFVFDPLSPDVDSFKVLPSAKTVLVSFGTVYKGAITRLVELYNETHPFEDSNTSRLFVQLGSWSAWQVSTDESSGTKVSVLNFIQ